MLLPLACVFGSKLRRRKPVHDFPEFGVFEKARSAWFHECKDGQTLTQAVEVQRELGNLVLDHR